MSLFDRAVRYAAKGIDAEGFLRWLLPEAFEAWRFAGWLDARRLPFPGEPDRTCDTVAHFQRRAGDRPDVAAVVEFEARPSTTILPRLGEYCLRVRSELPAQSDPTVRYDVAAAVVFLTGPAQPAEW